MNTKIEIYNKPIEDLPSIKEVTTPEIISENLPEISEDNENRKLPTLIAEEVLENAFLFMDGKEQGYAQFKVSDHMETWPINSKRFNSWLYKIGKPLNKDNIPASEHITTVRKYLDALAYEEDEIELFNRVAKSGGDIWYDLTNEKWQAIRINKTHWEIEDNFPPLFKRQTHQKKQITPVRGGDVWNLFEFVKVPETKKLLIMVYITSCFIPEIPHPVLIIYGPPGAGKSMAMEFLRQIIDPSHAPRLKMPKGDKEIVQVFDHHYATFFDNLDTLPNWFSDIVCRAVTGEGSEYRALYSDDGAIVRRYRRCVALNGINVAATQVDLLDRSILMELEKFPEGVRVEEKKLRSNFEIVLPGILGGIFDTLAKAIQIYPLVELESLPRMADFAKWGYAIAEALGGRGNEFIKSYSEDETERVHETINQNTLATVIVALIKGSETWRGNATELLQELANVAEKEKIQTNSSSWPKNPAWFSRKLNVIQPTLEHLGISITRSRENGQRYISIQARENTDHDVMLSLKANVSSKGESANSESLKNSTANLTASDCNDDSKTKKQKSYSETDCNDSMDSKNYNLKYSPISYDKLSEEELWDRAKIGDEKANDLLQVQFQDKTNSKKGSKVSK